MLGRVAIVAALVAALAAPPEGRAAPLRPFGSCQALLGYARAHSQKALRTGWTPTPMTIGAPEPVAVAPSAAKGGPAPAAAEDTAGGTAQPEFSSTNVQEQGVDEPDVVKTDGRTLFAVTNGVLHAVDVRGDAPVLLDSLALDEGWGHELLLDGDRLLVLQSAWLAEDDGTGRAVTRLTEVDVSDPAHLRVLRRERDDGEYVSARLTGHTARIVLASRAPVLVGIAEVRGTAARMRRARRARLAAWQPHTLFRDERRPKRARFHALTACGQVRHTARFSGLDTVTVLTVDMAKGLPSVDADAIMSDAAVVYASPDRLYVATQPWGAELTQIHAFDTSETGRTAYAASGSVSGSLLGQFALSERGGVLRAATTANDGSESAVVTLDAASLRPLGRVGGLGHGQRIVAVRFLGDAAYVVTFRRIDPLYVVDVSDAEHPRVAGDLELLGYSAYLHPLGGDLLLGVGQDADESGATTGTQLSLFDVADPAHPRRIAQRAIAGSSSTAEFDHHAFLWWPGTRLAVLPLAIYGDGDRPFAGAIGLRVTRDGIDEVGRIEHPADANALWDIQRATVVGQRLFTLSAAGVLSSALDTLAAGAFAAFPDKPAWYGGCGGGGGGPRPMASDQPIACPAAAAG